MENILLSSLLKNINTIVYQSFVENNISYYETKDDFFKDIYLKLLKELKKEYIKIINMAPEKVCLSILSSGPRKGEKCAVKTKDNSNYCKKHKSKEEGQMVLPEEDSPQSSSKNLDEFIDQNESPHSVDVHSNNTTRYIIKKNMFDNFVFGNTPYIFKSATEKYIVARQGLSGEWIPLTEEDKQICIKKYHLRCRDIDYSEKPSADISFIQNNIKLPYEIPPNDAPSPRKPTAKKEKVRIEEDPDDSGIVLNIKKKTSTPPSKTVPKKEKVKVEEESDDQQEVVLNVKKKSSSTASCKTPVTKKEKVKIEEECDEQQEVVLNVKKKSSSTASCKTPVTKKEKVRVEEDD